MRPTFSRGRLERSVVFFLSRFHFRSASDPRIQIRVCLLLVAVRLFSSVRFEKFSREIFDSSFIIQQQQPIRVGPSCARPFGHGRASSARPSYGPERPPLSELLPSVLWRCVVVVSCCGHAIRRIIMLCHLRRHGRLSTFHR